MQNTGYNNTTLKQQNRGLILKLIVTGECESRIELAKRTGLSKMAVTNIISEFMEQNLVEEKECVRIQGKGRNPIKLCLSSKAPKMIGVHIYRGECSVILCDFQLHILQRRSFQVTEENHGQLLEHLFHRIDEILDRIPRTEICGIGIGALGPVDVGKGRILNPPNFYGMKNIDIVSVLKARYEMPVFFDSQLLWQKNFLEMEEMWRILCLLVWQMESDLESSLREIYIGITVDLPVNWDM